MNAVSASSPSNGYSDSDTDPDEQSQYYYQPISVADNEEEFPNQEDLNTNSLHNNLPNGYTLQNGVSSLDLSDDEEESENEEESESAIERAMKEEDERRRNAPLTAENADRVMAAMSQISFGGFVPDWASEVSEDQWIMRLRGLRPAAAPSADAADCDSGTSSTNIRH